MLARQGAVLLGRRTYDEWSRYWPTSDEQPFADFINAVPKYVVTSTPLAGELGQRAVGLGPAGGGRRGCEGARRRGRRHRRPRQHHPRESLLAEGLVDELCLAVGRVLDPVGPRLFAGLPSVVELELVEAAPTTSGSVWLRYRLPAA